MSDAQFNASATSRRPEDSNQSDARVDKIVAAAETILIRDGYARLSMRAIAQECGISVGNLNYYFRRKNDLLLALIETIWRRYRGMIEQIRSAGFDSPRDELEAVLRFIFKDLGTRQTTVFFPELWALANHERYAAMMMERLYDYEQGVFTELIAKVRPDLSSKDQHRLALHVSASIEGHTLFVGHKKRFCGDQTIEDLAITTYLQLIEAHQSREDT